MLRFQKTKRNPCWRKNRQLGQMCTWYSASEKDHTDLQNMPSKVYFMITSKYC